MSLRRYRIHLEPEPEGGYTVTVPALRGCVTWGENYEHALEMAKEAIECYLESLIEDGEPIPDELSEEPVDAFVQISLPAA
jgi:predicted RNase H-like HicB family nuclease